MEQSDDRIKSSLKHHPSDIALCAIETSGPVCWRHLLRRCNHRFASLHPGYVKSSRGQRATVTTSARAEFQQASNVWRRGLQDSCYVIRLRLIILIAVEQIVVRAVALKNVGAHRS